MFLTKTGIVATVGPACTDEKIVTEMVEFGVTTFRLNFSHGTFEDHKKRLDLINLVRRKFPFEIAVMGDLCGPKLRISKVEPEGQSLKTGDRVVISSEKSVGSAYCFGTNYPAFVQDVQPGNRILLDDGQIALEAIAKTNTEIQCRVIIGGPVFSNKGINLPDSKLSIEAITEKDFKWVDWAVENNLDFLALSFVQTPDEIHRLKNYLAKKKSGIAVVAKIEKPRAVSNLESILEAADAALVARGDLGVEMDIAEVPLVQKRITKLCQKLGKPVIVATQVMQSMIDNPVPTRAEVSDVANAIMDFADAIMLSGETAVGKYPVEAVKAVAHICRNTEAWQTKQELQRKLIESKPGLEEMAAIARSIAFMLDHVEAKMVTVWTLGGHSARLLSKNRIDVPIVAICPDLSISRQMSLHYGIVPICMARPSNKDDFVAASSDIITKNGWAKSGDRILFGLPQDLLDSRTPMALFLRYL